MDFKEFERVFIREGDSQIPASGMHALRQMWKIIQESKEPADVGVALTLGLGYLLANTEDDDSQEAVIKTVVTTGMKINRIIQKGLEEDRKNEETSKKH